MIEGFEKETKPLSDKERNSIVPIIVSKLSLNIGRSKIVTNSRICSVLAAIGYKTSGERLRKMINYIRTNDLIHCLIATNNGYYVADDASDIERCIESLRGRANSILAVADELEKQQIKYFGKKEHEERQ